MGSGMFRLYRNLGFGLLTALLIIVSIVVSLTYTYRNATPANMIFHKAIQYHLAIVFALMLLSIAFGFFLSYLSSYEIQRKEQASRNVLDTVLLFLNSEEKGILHFLVEKEGRATQAEISRLPEMNRVKAFRTVQKMVEKNLVDVDAHGKVRNVKLRESIYQLLNS